MKKSESVNTFNKGLLMDLSPLVTPNDSLVNCLNGTILTYNRIKKFYEDCME